MVCPPTTRIVVLIAAVVFVAAAPCYAQELRDKTVSKSWDRLLGRPEVEELKNVPVVIDSIDDGKQIVVTVKNDGESNLIWMGTDDRPTLYQEIFYDDNWQANRWDWCGTGKQSYRLRPGESVALHIRFWDLMKKERMLTYFNEEGTLRAALVPLASESRAAQHRTK